MMQEMCVLLDPAVVWIDREMRRKYGVMLMRDYGYGQLGHRCLLLKGVTGWHRAVMEAGIIVSP